MEVKGYYRSFAQARVHSHPSRPRRVFAPRVDMSDPRFWKTPEEDTPGVYYPRDLGVPVGRVLLPLLKRWYFLPDATRNMREVMENAPLSAETRRRVVQEGRDDQGISRIAYLAFLDAMLEFGPKEGNNNHSTPEPSLIKEFKDQLSSLEDRHISSWKIADRLGEHFGLKIPGAYRKRLQQG